MELGHPLSRIVPFQPLACRKRPSVDLLSTSPYISSCSFLSSHFSIFSHFFFLFPFILSFIIIYFLFFVFFFPGVGDFGHQTASVFLHPPLSFLLAYIRLGLPAAPSKHVGGTSRGLWVGYHPRGVGWIA